MKLYHASPKVFNPGDSVSAIDPQSRFPHALPVVDAARLTGAPSRTCCLFAAKTPVAAATIIEAELPEGTSFYVYEVDMPAFHIGPMRLITEIERRLRRGEAVAALVIEYWQPRRSWHLMEYFGPQFFIIKELPMPSYADLLRFKQDYEQDIALSKSLAG